MVSGKNKSLSGNSSFEIDNVLMEKNWRIFLNFYKNLSGNGILNCVIASWQQAIAW